jgi:hypothetical protein
MPSQRSGGPRAWLRVRARDPARHGLSCIQRGRVKSPVATRPMPFCRAARRSEGKSRSRMVVREKRECT